ncbi:hypothetical protein YB2330_006621 [Saitoella coloradoensis]
MILIPSEYGYVILVATFSTVVNLWHGINVGQTRKAAGVPYPIAYATDQEAASDLKKKKFNCAVRAHANFTENYSAFLVTLIFGGLNYPVASAACGAVYLAGRVIYTLGYTTGDPDKRARGFMFHIGELGLLVLSGLTGYKAITQGI